MCETFGNTIKDLLEKREIKQKDFAEECGMTTSLLNKVLNSGRESEFEKILTLVRRIIAHHGQLQEEKMMSLYISGIRNSSNIKSAMEYCDTHDMKETLQILCDRADSMADHKNQLKEYSTMYQLNMERKNQQFEENVTKELFNKIISQKNKVEEMKIFQSILEIVMFQQEKKINKIIDYTPKLEIQLENSKSKLIKSFNMRLNNVLQTVYLRNICDFEKSRDLSFESLRISIGNRFEAASYVNLGDSCIHDEDPTLAIEYLEKSIQIYKEIGLDDAADWMVEKIEFISILRGKKIDSIKHETNKALKYILDGRKEDGLKLLDTLKATPKTQFIRGMGTDDPENFWDSLDGYMERGDRLYGLFSVLELKRLGEREKVVDMVYNASLRR
ncbi:AimR family lysis-lysogeny pheromone receptor [Jeotgalibacillus marinus]|uniref:AimR family lysis-lysogeny pheromone receptor n=1 Tax=Jeotgalibacillus marinus TaxID=86667 RepID=A0ABV3Q7F0_9BACL